MEVKVICGALVVKDDKFVLVKEAQKHVYGKWNLPAGHLEMNDTIFETALKEVKEETGLDVKLDGLIGIYQQKSNQGNNVVIFIFKASHMGGKLKYPEDEILDAKWFSFQEFSKLKNNELRGEYLKEVIKDYKKRGILTLDIVKSYGF